MATLFVTEFAAADFAVPEHGAAPVALQPPVAEQAVSFTTTTQSSAFSAETRIVRLYSTADCHVAFGTNPTATTSKMKLKADSPEYFAVPVGQSYKVAAVTA